MPSEKKIPGLGMNVQRTIDEVKERLATALTGVRLARAKAVRWTNIFQLFVPQCRVMGMFRWLEVGENERERCEVEVEVGKS